MNSNYRRFDIFTPISALIERVGKKKLTNNFNNKFIEHQIMANWEKIVGNQIAPFTQPGFLRGQDLYIRTISSVWAAELGFMKETLINNINYFFKRKTIKNIFFNVGEVYKPLNKYAGDRDINQVEINSKEQEEIEKAVAPLNGEIKDLLTRIMIKSIKRNKFKNELNNKK